MRGNQWNIGSGGRKRNSNGRAENMAVAAAGVGEMPEQWQWEAWHYKL